MDQATELAIPSQLRRLRFAIWQWPLFHRDPSLPIQSAMRSVSVVVR
ncbi:MAG TPA: hypothetical protein VFC03_01340 [Acidimicrobiales bacterium]|nr:hypothetical protein [Acidimicrobiales bacterium]